MGTGGYHSGGGGGGSSSGGTRVRGGYSFRNGRAEAAGLSPTAGLKKIQSVFNSLSRSAKPYLRRQLCGPLIEGVFRELFAMDACLNGAEPARELMHRYGVGPDQSFVQACGNAIMRKLASAEHDERIQSAARMCFEGVLLRALGEDFSAFGGATCKEFVAAVDRAVFKSLSGHFLGVLCWQISQREMSGLSISAEVQMQGIVQVRADRVIRELEREFVSKGYRHDDLVRVIRENEDWFRRLMS
jgi:hypothetical protein